MLNLVITFFLLTAHNPISTEYFLCKLNDIELCLIPWGIIFNQTKYM